MSEESVIRVNFGRPMPLFPLTEVRLFPHGLLPLQIFEDRYRQMVDDVLDNYGQIAMAVYSESDPAQWEEVTPPLRPVVCIGQILQHQRLPDGRFNIALQGVCRARIHHELPVEGGRLYREAVLEPLGVIEAADETFLAATRKRLAHLLGEEPLTDLRDSEAVLEHMRNPGIPTSAILELMTLSFINDNDIRYRLLATPDPMGRARVVQYELESIAKILKQARSQRAVEWPKGCSWN